MIISYICSLSAIIFIATLYTVFKSKLKFNNAKSRLYKYMMFVLFTLCLLVVAGEVSYNLDYIDAGTIVMKTHWYGIFLLILIFYYYIISFISNFKYEKILDIFRSSLYIKITTIICLIMSVIALFIPIDLRTNDSFNFIPGTFGIYLNAYMISVIIMVLIYYKWFNKSEDNKFDKTVIFGFILIFTICLLLQVLVVEVSFYGIAFIAMLCFLYSTSENPDLEMIDNLKKLNDEIVASSNAKTDIILNMSHDIRSPMNAIVNYSAELTEIKELDKEAINDNIDNILVAGKNLLNILDDILEMSGNDTHVGIDTYNIVDLVEDLRNITESRIGNKPIKLELNVDSNMPQLLMGNSAKLYRILMNILSNSAKYTDVGRIVLDITGTKVDNSNLILHIKVSDTGFGIRDEDKPKVFSEFSRLKDATNQKIEGTGLGIANTKKNVEVLGGKIWFESTYGAGTTFFVDLPQKICLNKSIEEYNNEKDITNKKLLDCSKLTALIVDDNKMNVNVTARLLNRYGFKTDFAYSGNECIDKIKNGRKYDIIFMDLVMGDLEGKDVLNVLRYLNKQYDIPPIVALTANVLNGTREACLKMGFDEYLAKSIDIRELDRIINLFFKNK